MWITKIVEFVNGYKWVFTILSALSALVAIGTYLDSNGYNRAIAKMSNASAKAVEQATAKQIEIAHKEMQDALNKQAKIHADELARRNQDVQTKIVTKEIIKHVDKIKIEPRCSIVSDDAIRLLNDSINNRSPDGTESSKVTSSTTE
tara:strand:+ start:532 stop:972 length:441 start_codon:yes stop_codon:yes gene_type:complete